MTKPDFAALLEQDAASLSKRALRRLELLVRHETPSRDAARLDALADAVAGLLEEAGGGVALVREPELGTHVDATIPGDDSELEPLLILGHMDTVHPVGTLAERPFRVEGGKAYGPGAYDMKAGIAVLLETLAVLHEAGGRPRRPVRVLLTCDEEIGSHTSRPRLEDAARAAHCVLVLEPSMPDGGVKTGRKGVGVYTVTANGVAVHAGIDSGGGVNAVVELAHQVLRLLELADPERGTTLNPGVIRGGTVSNVIPASAWLEVDVRFRELAEGERVDAAMHALKPVTDGAGLVIEGGINRPPLERTEAIAALYEEARGLAAGLGMDLTEGSTGGASDGCFTAAVGAPTLDGLGVRGDGAHAVHEHVLVEDLPRRVALYGRLLQAL